jgi:uncharacterized membrane protein YbhN (UPF0104 family)
MKRRAAGLISLAMSAGLITLLYRAIDVRHVVTILGRARPVWTIVSVSLIVPITLLRAVRFYLIAPKGAIPGVAEAFRLTLVASALNVVAPAKAGDLVKSYWVATRGASSVGVALAVIAYERVSDLFGLIAWCCLGYVLGRPDVPALRPLFWLALAACGGVCGVLIASERASALWRVVVGRVLPGDRFQSLHGLAEGWSDLLDVLRGRRRWILPFSLVLWVTHLFQIWLFTVALSARVPFMVCLSLAAVALLAGQLPLTVAGVGARDVALVVLLARYTSPETAAALGVLMVTRNILPPLIGMPILPAYLSTVLADARRWRTTSRMRSISR